MMITHSSGRRDGGAAGILLPLTAVGFAVYLLMGGSIGQLRERFGGSASTETAEGTADEVPAPDQAEDRPPLDMATLSADRSLRPTAVALRQKTAFDAMHNGRVVGTVEVPPGVELKVVAIKGNTVIVSHMGVPKPVPVSQTDLIERVSQRRR